MSDIKLTDGEKKAVKIFVQTGSKIMKVLKIGVGISVLIILSALLFGMYLVTLVFYPNNAEWYCASLHLTTPDEKWSSPQCRKVENDY